MAIPALSAPAGGEPGRAEQSGPPLDLVQNQTVPGLGAGQGIAVHKGRVYLYGDAKTGIVREFRFRHKPTPRLAPTGREIRLTKGGKNIISHPTGLTFHPEHGAVIGDTVSGKGTLHFVDFERALADGNLDRALLHTVQDDAARNGTRPEFLRRNGRWYIGTSDYGDKGNELRLYRPERLRRAKKTSDPGVVAERLPSGAFVQTLHWVDGADTLVFAQNQAGGRGYRLTFFDARSRRAPHRVAPYDVPGERRELEGFALLPGGWALLLNAHEKDNLQLARLRRPLDRTAEASDTSRRRARSIRKRLRRARPAARKRRARSNRRAFSNRRALSNRRARSNRRASPKRRKPARRPRARR